MTQNSFVFRITAMNEEEYLSQVSYALEKRTELSSRIKYPGVWKATDKLNEISKEEKGSPRRTKMKSVLFLALGIFCFVPGVMRPKDLLGSLLIGAAAIVWGLYGLLRGKIKRKNPFDKSARLLLEQRKTFDDAQVSFAENGMTLVADGEEELIPYEKFEYVIEAAGLFLLTFDGKVIVVKKDDLVSGELSEFSPFISDHTAFVGNN